MLFCRDGNSFRSLWCRTLFLLLLIVQVSPVFGQPVDGQDPSDEKLPVLEFDEVDLPLSREGYVSLNWNSVEGAVEYRLTDNQNRQSYQGPFTQAFVSGLSDGDFSFDVEAVDASGEVVAKSAEAARLTVLHWSLVQAISLMIVGLIVFVSIVVVIVRGWLHSASAKPNAIA